MLKLEFTKDPWLKKTYRGHKDWVTGVWFNPNMK